MDPFHNPVIFIIVIVLLVWVVKIVYDWLEKRRLMVLNHRCCWASGMNNCEILLARDVEDASGYPCGRDASENLPTAALRFAICMLSLVSFCGKSFCSPCYFFHLQEPHAKPAMPSSSKTLKERSA
ncbi:MAG: hypothetical protein DMG85_07840 [Acidobacteria bacterium]|nr:MAG: hypothetical protein DMG85_07840 [Acidobacteriota bacterium]